MGAASAIASFPAAYGAALQAGHSAGVARQNAKIADMAAEDSLNRGSVATAREQLKGAQVEGEQKAQYGASGVTLAGSPTEVMRDTSFFTDLNVQTAMNNAAREAWGYKVKSGQLNQQADIDTQAGAIGVAGYALGADTGGIIGGGG